MQKPMYFDRDLLRSPVFRSLRVSSMLVYLDFLGKRKMQKANRKAGKSGWVIINNGEIEYTYSEAEAKGITRPRFMRALDELIAKGFIDVAHSGTGGVKGDKSLYAFSERWRKYGTDEFVERSRPKDRRSGRGWAAYHERRRFENAKIIKFPKRESGMGNENVKAAVNDYVT